MNETMPTAMPDDTKYLDKGVHTVTIIKVDFNRNNNSEDILSKNGYKSILVTLQDSNGAILVDKLYYGNKKVQRIYDGLMEIIGLDKKDG